MAQGGKARSGGHGGRTKGWGLVKFERGTAEELWKHGSAGEWPHAAADGKPNARIVRIQTAGRRVFYHPHAGGEAREPLDAVVVVHAESEDDLYKAAEYIEAHFTHVEMYSLGADFGW